MAGEGRAEAGYPRIAGQPQAYLERQLEAYADGRRKSAVMGPLAKRLGREDRARVAAHFAGLVPGASQAGGARAPANERGALLAHTGDNRLRVQACQNCHGPRGAGLAPYGAALAGQLAPYLKAELLAWRSGRRNTDPSGAMAVIARSLGEGDIDAVADYYASLPAPGATASDADGTGGK